MEFSNVFWQNAAAKTRYVVNQGGTSSSKTWSILQLLLMIALKSQGIVISVVSMSYPHLKRGALKDFIKILEKEGLYNEKKHNKSDNVFKFGTSYIEFFSVDDSEKVHGSRRDILFVNECNFIKFDTVDQLETRTAKRIYLDFNPVKRFWVHDEILGNTDHTFIKSTYLDAKEFLPESIVSSIESKKHRKNWWKVYGLGEIGELEGLVFPDFVLVDKFGQRAIDGSGAKFLGYGLDFGYTNNHTALVKCFLTNRGIGYHQLLYKKGMQPDDIVKKLKHLNIQGRIVADYQQQQTIDYIKSFGFDIHPCSKGRNSVQQGIDFMKNYKIHITRSSVDLIEELKNYTWKTDRDGNKTNEPEGVYNDLIDAARYITVDALKPKAGIIKIY